MLTITSNEKFQLAEAARKAHGDVESALGAMQTLVQQGTDKLALGKNPTEVGKVAAMLAAILTDAEAKLAALLEMGVTVFAGEESAFRRAILDSEEYLVRLPE